MKRYTGGLLFICICLSLSLPAMAGPHFAKPQYAVLMAVDKKSRTISVRNTVYKLRYAVKIHDPANKFPTLDSLHVGHEIKFRTRKNPRSGEVEISEIWIQYM